MAFQDTIRLWFGHGLISGHIPDSIQMSQVAKKIEEQVTDEDIASFGLFDSNTANYNTYYPDVTEEDLKPKDSEFIEPVFRGLSEVIVHKGFNPVDFGMNGVLKKSMPLLKGQTVNVDHEMSVGNAVGSVKEVSWENSYKTPAGIIVPAGINTKLKIDGKSNPKLVRNIMMDPPAVHSTSVTVQFLWEKSHNDLTEQDFFQKLGSYDKDGKMIRRIASLIKNYHEISLVGHGADPFAQKIKDDGQINNPKWADVAYNSANPKKQPATKYFRFDFKSDVLNNSDEVTIPEETNDNNTSQTTVMNKAFLLALAIVLGLKHKVGDKEEDFTEDTITEDIVQNGVANIRNEVTALSARPDISEDEVTRLRGIEEEFKKLPADTGVLKAFMDTATENLRKETLRNLGIVNSSPVASIVTLIGKADYATLTALNDQYKLEADKKFPMKCKDCDSTNISRASVTITPGEESGGSEGSKRLTAQEVQDKIRKERNKGAFKTINAE
jgi:hypothetical protein